MKLLSAVLGLAFSVVALPAVAAVHDGIVLSDLQAVLAQSGMQSTADTTKDGIPFLTAQIPGTQVPLLIGGIACKTACDGFAIAAWSNDKASPEFLNTFNKSCCYVHAVFENDGTPRVTAEYLELGGVADANIVANVQSFIAGLVRYSKMQGDKSADLGDEGPASLTAPKSAFGDLGKKLLAGGSKAFVGGKISAQAETVVSAWASRPAE